METQLIMCQSRADGVGAGTGKTRVHRSGMVDKKRVEANATSRRWAGNVASTVLAVMLPAGVVFGFMFVRPVVLLVIVGLGQGILVGVGLKWVWKRYGEIRSKGAVAAIGGLISASLLYAILYLREVWFMAGQTGRSTWGAMIAMLGIGNASPYALLDQFMLVPATGHGGFIGYVMFRIAESENFANMLVAHVAVCVLLSWRVAIYARGNARGAILRSNSAA
jgi:hypothetical protein